MAHSYNTPEEDAIIRAASEGDRDAFCRIVSMYEKFVYNALRMKIGCAEDAFDLSQEVFIKLWRHLARYRGDCRFSTWIYKICMNTALDHLRREKNVSAEPMPTYTDKDGDEVMPEFRDEDEASSPESVLEKNEAVRTVRRAISRLSEEQREVILLRDIEGYSYEEISDMLNLEIGTVKSRLNRARTNLKTLLTAMRNEGHI